MDNLLFTFKATNKILGSGLEQDVSVYENKIVMHRKVLGMLAMNTKLPNETTAYYTDLTGISFAKPTGIGGFGWIELCGISTGNGNVTKSVNVNGKLINNVDMSNAIGNQYCIVFCNKEKSEMESNYEKIKKAFEEAKSKSHSGGSITNIVQEESALDKIKKLKELLDLGVINQAEFDEKKNELMKNI